jgi:hypothetical protein
MIAGVGPNRGHWTYSKLERYKLAAIFEAGYECFLQVAPVLFYKMDAKTTA